MNRAIQQNRVAAFRIIPYLPRTEILFMDEVKSLLNVTEESLKELKASLNKAEDLDEKTEME